MKNKILMMFDMAGTLLPNTANSKLDKNTYDAIEQDIMNIEREYGLDTTISFVTGCSVPEFEKRLGTIKQVSPFLYDKVDSSIVDNNYISLKNNLRFKAFSFYDGITKADSIDFLYKDKRNEINTLLYIGNDNSDIPAYFCVKHIAQRNGIDSFCASTNFENKYQSNLDFTAFATGPEGTKQCLDSYLSVLEYRTTRDEIESKGKN